MGGRSVFLCAAQWEHLLLLLDQSPGGSAADKHALHPHVPAGPSPRLVTGDLLQHLKICQRTQMELLPTVHIQGNVNSGAHQLLSGLWPHLFSMVLFSCLLCRRYSIGSEYLSWLSAGFRCINIGVYSMGFCEGAELSVHVCRHLRPASYIF